MADWNEAQPGIDRHLEYGSIPWHTMKVGETIVVRASTSTAYMINKKNPHLKFSTAGSYQEPDGYIRLTRLR